MTRPRAVLAALAVSAFSASVLVSCSSSDTESSQDPAGSSRTSDLRDQRYCEILPSVREGTTIRTTIFNTINLNDCPEEAWTNITEEVVMEQYGADAAELNGPRRWVLDEIVGSGSSVNQPQFTFGTDPGLLTREVATIESKIADAAGGKENYAPNLIKRDTVWVFKAGQPVFELTDTEGNVYVMQSYAQFVDPNLTYDQLSDVGSRLQLPDGWKFSTRVLDDDLELNTAATDGIAYVIQDDLSNSYMRNVQ